MGYGCKLLKKVHCFVFVFILLIGSNRPGNLGFVPGPRAYLTVQCTCGTKLCRF